MWKLQLLIVLVSAYLLHFVPIQSKKLIHAKQPSFFFDVLQYSMLLARIGTSNYIGFLIWDKFYTHWLTGERRDRDRSFSFASEYILEQCSYKNRNLLFQMDDFFEKLDTFMLWLCKTVRKNKQFGLFVCIFLAK
jgi:hypothetical protein